METVWRVLKKLKFDAQSRAFKAGALTTQRDGVGRDVGGFRMGDTCTPVADSCPCTAETATIL